jgi:integrase
MTHAARPFFFRTPSTPAYRRQPKKNGHDLAFVLLAGRKFYLGRYDTPESRARYHQFIAEWELAGRLAPALPEEITVEAVAHRYLTWARTYYVKHGRPTTEPRDIESACGPLLAFHAQTPAAQFGPKALKLVRQAMIERGWVRKRINRNVDRIKRMFKWAVAEELIPPTAYEGLRAVAGLRFGRCGAHDNPPVKSAPDELVQPVKAFVSRQVAAMIDLQLLTGARPGEIVIMRPCDLDRSQPVWLYRPSEHKTEHHGLDRMIFVGPKAQDLLAHFLLRPAEAYCFSPAEADRERRAELTAARTTPQSCGNVPGKNRRAKPGRHPGDHYTRDSYRRAIDRAIELAFPPREPLQRRQGTDGQPETLKDWHARLTAEEKAELKAWYRQHHWHPHQLRHNCGTYVRKEFGLEAAQILLGHSKADVTQVYAERDVSRAFTVAAKIG